MPKLGRVTISFYCYEKRKKTSRPMFEPQGKMELESMVLVDPDPVLAEACLDQVCECVCIVYVYVCICVCRRVCLD